MKNNILAIIMSAMFVSSSYADTHFKVADLGEIVISKDGDKAGILSNFEGNKLFKAVHTEEVNGCDVGIYAAIEDPKDMLTVSVCDQLKPMVKFGRYYDGEKVSGWLVDTSHYMYFTENK